MCGMRGGHFNCAMGHIDSSICTYNMFAVYVVDVPKTPILENTNVSDKIYNSLAIVSLLFTSTAINTLKYWYVDANCPNQLTYSSHLFYYLMPLKNMAMTFVKYVKVHENFLLNCSWE